MEERPGEERLGRNGKQKLNRQPRLNDNRLGGIVLIERFPVDRRKTIRYFIGERVNNRMIALFLLAEQLGAEGKVVECQEEAKPSPHYIPKSYMPKENLGQMNQPKQ